MTYKSKYMKRTIIISRKAKFAIFQVFRMQLGGFLNWLQMKNTIQAFNFLVQLRLPNEGSFLAGCLM